MATDGGCESEAPILGRAAGESDLDESDGSHNDRRTRAKCDRCLFETPLKIRTLLVSVASCATSTPRAAWPPVERSCVRAYGRSGCDHPNR